MTNLDFFGETNQDTEQPQLTWKDLEVRYSDVEWIFSSWIAQGMTTMIVGPPGTGKSYLILAFVKTMMDGGTWPDGSAFVPTIEGAKVLWIETEGGEPINIPRAKKMGIDTARICTIHTALTDGSAVDLTCKQDLELITTIAGDPLIVAIVVDSLSGGHNTNENETSAGKVVQAIAKIAGAVNKPILLAHHVNKMGFAPGSPSMVHVRGSSAQLQYARIIAMLDSPDATKTRTKRITCIKNNLVEKPAPLGFEVHDAGPTWCNAPQAFQRERSNVKRLDRDAKVLDMIESGDTYAQISKKLGTSKATISGIVKRHREALEFDEIDEDEMDVPSVANTQTFEAGSLTVHRMESIPMFKDAPS